MKHIVRKGVGGFYTVRDVSELMRVTDRTIYNWIKKELIVKPISFGGQKHLWPKGDIQKWIARAKK